MLKEAKLPRLCTHRISWLASIATSSPAVLGWTTESAGPNANERPYTPRPLPSCPALCQTATTDVSCAMPTEGTLWSPVLVELRRSSLPWLEPSARYFRAKTSRLEPPSCVLCQETTKWPFASMDTDGFV